MKTVDTELEASEMFEDFYARPSKRRVNFDFGWPRRYQEVGVAQAQMYRSNKWKKNLKEFEDYKHVAEGEQHCYVVPGFLRDYETNKPLKTYGPMIELDEEMPQHITILAPLIGVQVQLYDRRGKIQKGENLYEIVVPHGMLAGGRFPRTEEAFLVVYTKSEGVHMIITGEELDIERDGIVG